MSEDTLAAVRSFFASRRRGRPTTARYLLSGLLRCGVCGHGLTGHTSASGRRRYSCRNVRGCGRVSIDMRHSDEQVRAMTLDVLADPRHAEQVARRSKAVEQLDTEIANAEHTACEIGARLGRGEIDLDRHDAIMEPLDLRLADLRSRRVAMISEGGEMARPVTSAFEDLQRLWGDVDDDDAAVQRRRGLVRQAYPLGLLVLPSTGGRARFDSGRIRAAARPDG